MATISFTLAPGIGICPGGGHVTFDVSLNGGASRRVMFTSEEIRAPLSNLTVDERDQLALAILKLHFAGRTKAQAAAELNAGPVEVTI